MKVPFPSFVDTIFRSLLLCTFCCLCLGLNSDLKAQGSTEFDHFSSGFPLEGRHIGLECDSCHNSGIFRGTPTQCESCHRLGGFASASAKPLTHIKSTNFCEDCHTDSAWEPVLRIDHNATLGSCLSCHNGTISSGKHPTHIASVNTCDDCHVTNTWNDVRFDHAGVTDTCTSCHNGTIATGKPTTHILTASQCDDCHSSVAWTPANFDHDAVIGSCSSCHNGSTATGKPANHFVTSVQCDQCHTVNNWVNTDFMHTSAVFPGEHRSSVECSDCHTANNQIPTWPTAAYKPDCAGCHASEFKTDPHKKYENPDAKYTVSELRDCTGSCHIYTDSSLTTIKERRNNEHRTTDGDF